jgi:hypothetical protein
MTEVISHIDEEIAKLQQARALLVGGATTQLKTTRGRPKGSKNVAPVSVAVVAKKRKRQLSPEGRKAIADAMKKRWAERRKAATAK